MNEQADVFRMPSGLKLGEMFREYSASEIRLLFEFALRSLLSKWCTTPRKALINTTLHLNKENLRLVLWMRCDFVIKYGCVCKKSLKTRRVSFENCIF